MFDVHFLWGTFSIWTPQLGGAVVRGGQDQPLIFHHVHAAVVVNASTCQILVMIK